MELNGIPLHPLVVHAAVIFTPLAALAAIVFALVPKWRFYLRWPTLVVGLMAFGAMFTARITGQDLEEKLVSQGVQNRWIDIHEGRADILLWVMLGFTLLLIAAFLVTPALDGTSRVSAPAVAVSVVHLVLVVLALWTLVQVFLVGDAGARAVWNPS